MKSLLPHINFAECPSWVFSLGCSKKNVLDAGPDLKFGVSSANDFPEAQDVLLFYYLLSLAFDSVSGNYGYSVVAECRNISMRIYGSPNFYDGYKTIVSLKKWNSLQNEFCALTSQTIPFTFFVFNFIDSFQFSESNDEISVEFGHKYIDLLNSSQNTFPLPFSAMEKLDSIESKYLYRFLLELFLNKNMISLSMNSLQKSGAFFADTSAEILEKLLAAIIELNNVTDFMICMTPLKSDTKGMVFKFMRG
jgi:hypothetical protein